MRLNKFFKSLSMGVAMATSAMLWASPVQAAPALLSASNVNARICCNTAETECFYCDTGQIFEVTVKDPVGAGCHAQAGFFIAGQCAPGCPGLFKFESPTTGNTCNTNPGCATNFLCTGTGTSFGCGSFATTYTCGTVGDTVQLAYYLVCPIGGTSDSLGTQCITLSGTCQPVTEMFTGLSNINFKSGANFNANIDFDLKAQAGGAPEVNASGAAMPLALVGCVLLLLGDRRARRSG